MKKPKDNKEIEQFIFDKLKEEYGDAVRSTKPGNQIVVDTETEFRGVADVWIDINYFH